MLTLSVDLDTSLIEILNKHNRQPSREEWADFCKSKQMDQLAEYTLLDNEGKLMDKEELLRFNQTVDYLTDNLGESVNHIAKVFPDIPDQIVHDLTISFLPHGKTNFGPHPSQQLFSLIPEANPYETYLFLIHVYYHEISFINYTEYCEECSNNPDTANKLKYFILTLIQNEGIGNYAVLKELINFREDNPTYTFQYFTYANYLRDHTKVVQSMSLLRQMLNDLSDDNFTEYKKKINLVLKNKQLPIINLVGTYMAEVIADHFGVDVLRNVYNRSATEFFNLYLRTEDPLKKHLLLDNENLNYFKELVQ